jgi:hypothetical protein
MHKIIEILEQSGPLTGRELRDRSGLDELSLWRICNKSDRIILKSSGKRFLRLDSCVKGYARLSPSIKREFLTYTVAGLKEDSKKIDDRVKSVCNEIKNISGQKKELARSIVEKIVKSQNDPEIINKRGCFIVAGDVVFRMAHSEPRPEISTNEIVRGSDLDIIVVTENLSEKFIKNLDHSIYREKYYLIKNPSYREEIDYIIKDIEKVKKQLDFSTFKFKVASKILYEGNFLYGNRDIFRRIKAMLLERKIPEKIKALEDEAIMNRKNAESYLLECNGLLQEEEYIKLFYTRQEKEEIF